MPPEPENSTGLEGPDESMLAPPEPSGGPEPFVAPEADGAGAEPARPPTGIVGPLLPTLIGRIGIVEAAVGALSMRIDAIGAAVASLRSVLSDRLTDYTEAAAAITRAQTESIEEYRRVNDRVVTELRRTVGETDESSRRVASRVEETAADVQALGELLRTLDTGAGTIASSHENVKRELGESLEEFAGSLSDRLDELTSEWRAATDETRLAVRRIEAAAATTPPPAAAPSEASVDAGAIAAAVQLELGAALDDIGDRLGRVETTLAASPREWAAPLTGDVDDPAIASELALLRDEVLQLKRRIGVRARTAVTLDDQELERIVSSIVDRLEASIEVVPDTAVVVPPAPAKKASGPRRPRRTSNAP
jgi:hypothetical protein